MSAENGSTPTVKLGSPLVSVQQAEHVGEQRYPQADPLNGMPMWAKVAGTLSAVALVFALFTFLVVNMVRTQDRGVETLERLVDKFDNVLQKHDLRMSEWLRSQGDRNSLEHEKTRVDLRAMIDESKRASQESVKLHEAQLRLLEKIANK